MLTQYKKYLLAVMILTVFSCSDKNTPVSGANLHDYCKRVDIFIGTAGDGHTFPGAVLPNGMMQLSPDTKTSTWNNCSGYHYSDKTIMGFSHTHYSGTGAAGGGDILFMPTTGAVQLSAGDINDTQTGYRSKFSHDKENAAPGFYSVFLDDYNIRVNLTASERVGFHQYIFPQSDQANVILDLVHGIADSPDSLFLKIDNNEISGYRAASGGLDKSNTIYFTAKFSKPFKSYAIAVNDTIKENLKAAKGRNIKAFFRFSTQKDEAILLKAAISTVSIEGARKNMAAEIPHWDFDQVRREAKDIWNRELNKIQVEGGTEDQQKIFYTALYHAHIHPTLYMDVDGKYRSADKKIYTAPKGFINYTTFSLWDTFRALHPLLTIINQKNTNQFIKTFIERRQHTSHMPIMEFSGSETYTMIGYHSIPVVADAYVKGIRDYDLEKAYQAVKQLADGERAAKEDYLRYGYVPDDFYIESVSRTLEYSYDDWCVTRMAKDFNEKDFQNYSARGEFYRNLFSKEIGFMRPKNSRYKWVQHFDPMEVTKLHFTEANAYQYTPFVPQDIHGLIKLFGGDNAFEAWLDKLFSTQTKNKISDVDVTGLLGQYAQGNEPSHHIAYLYNYVGAAWKTQELIRRLLTTFYTEKPDGLIGNEDAGQMSAWYIFSAMGFYPVSPGLDYYTLGSPLFDKVTINLENGKKFELTIKNNGADHPYIQSATLNGKPYAKTYINHSDIMNGSKMEMVMGKSPNKNRGKDAADRPYSPQYECAPMPMIHTDGRKFLDCASVILTSNDKNALIRYTLDGSEPNEHSLQFGKAIVIKNSCVLTARCFVKDKMPGFPAAFDFRKLELNPALNKLNVKPGIKYIYKEAGAARTSDLDKYPADNIGTMAVFDIDSIKDQRAFGYNFEGYIKAPADGLYTFYLESNDGSTLFIDGKLLIDNDGDHMLQTMHERIALKKGLHSIKLNYFQMGGGKKLEIKWKTPLSDVETIPADVLFH